MLHSAQSKKAPNQPGSWAHRPSVTAMSAVESRRHPAPLFTDRKSHAVGTQSGLRSRETPFDTPTPVECWRTAPYLHNGSVASLREVLTTRNPGDRHGKTSHLTLGQIEDLVAYVRCL
jgi:hypothetical protein